MGVTNNGCWVAPDTSCPGMNLSYAVLRFACIDGANLRGANLYRAKITHWCVTGVLWEGVDLTETYTDKERWRC